MAEARVVDTNVLIVASAADDGSPFRPESTPVEEAALRQLVFDWLHDFEANSRRHAVLDVDWHICREYQNKLTDQDYGWMAVMAKQDRNQVVWVKLQVDEHGHAALPNELSTAVTDKDDRKMVAAVLAATEQGHDCQLTNACDTDWLDCEDAMTRAGVAVEHLIEPWLRAKWATKQVRK